MSVVKPGSTDADIFGMRVRAGFVVVLVVVVAGVAAWFSFAGWRHHTDQRNLREAVAVAHRLNVPDGATTSKECRGDGLISCWTSPRATADAARSLAASLRSIGSHPTLRCDRVRVGAGADATTADECTVIARYGSRAVAVFADPQWRHTATGNVVDGSLISVSAA